MGELLSYSIASSLLLIALYLPYKWLLSGIRRPLYNRVTLLLIYAVALGAIPLASLMSHGEAATRIGNAGIDIGMAIVMPVGNLTNESGATLVDWLIGVYTIGIAVMCARWIYAALKIRRVICKSRRIYVGATPVYVSSDSDIAPFSVFGHIVIPENDLEDAPLIVAHEEVHVARRHSIDLIPAELVTIIQWFNPAAWLMLSELKAVHEYEADNGVIDSGVNIKEYQLLLIKKAVGERLPSPANSLNQSNLKTRITMMMKTKRNGNSRWRYLALVPSAAVALSVINLNAVADTLRDVAAGHLPQLSGSEVTDYSSMEQADVAVAEEFSAAVMATDSEAAMPRPSETASAAANSVEAESPVSVPSREAAPEAAKPAQEVLSSAEQMPRYPGGEMELLKDVMKNVVYPESAMKANKQGRVIVKFIVDAQGKVQEPTVLRGKDPDLDNAAIEAVKKLKNFEPGRTNGKPVAVYYVLPVSFKLEGDDKAESAITSTNISKSNTTITITGSNGEATTLQGSNLTIFVDGKKIDTSELNKIKPDDIAAMSIEKNDPEYPDGKVIIVLKK